MSQNTFNIIYTGYLDPHADKEQFIQDFCAKFRIPKAKALSLANSKTEILLKKNLDIERAQKYHNTLKKMGMIVRMEANIPTETDPTQSSTQIIAPPYDKTEITPSLINNTCPSCGSEQLNELSCMSCGKIFEDEDTLGETQVLSSQEIIGKPSVKKSTEKKNNNNLLTWLLITGLIILSGITVTLMIL